MAAECSLHSVVMSPVSSPFYSIHSSFRHQRSNKAITKEMVSVTSKAFRPDSLGSANYIYPNHWRGQTNVTSPVVIDRSQPRLLDYLNVDLRVSFLAAALAVVLLLLWK
jgi:hypothetical protein